MLAEQIGVPDPASAAASRRGGQIAVLISRKDSKLYVRQNFAPLFDVPVTVAPDNRPLGTHVFTTQVDRNDASVLHWSVVSMPAVSGQALPRDDDEPVWRKRRLAGATETKPLPLPDGPVRATNSPAPSRSDTPRNAAVSSSPRW